MRRLNQSLSYTLRTPRQFHEQEFGIAIVLLNDAMFPAAAAHLTIVLPPPLVKQRKIARKNRHDEQTGQRLQPVDRLT